MKPQATNQEILLFTGTSFTNRSFSHREDDKEQRNYSAMEELERACWDGILNELLPELVGDASYDNNNYLWHTVSGVNFLCVNIGPHPVHVEKETSLDPYLFLNGVRKN